MGRARRRRRWVAGTLVAGVATAALAAPAADARSVEVPLFSSDQRDVAAGLLALRVHVPRRAKPLRPLVNTSSLVTFPEGRCRVTVALSGVLSTSAASGAGTRRAAPDATLIDLSGRRRHLPVRRSPARFPKRKDLAPAAYATLHLPSDVLTGFAWRDLAVAAYWPFKPYESCRRAQVAAALDRALRRIDLRVTGAYAPDAPAPEVRVADRPVLTIDAPHPNFLEEPLAIEDSDGDGRPEVGVVVVPEVGGWNALTDPFVNLATLDGHVSVTDPAAVGLTIHHVLDRDGVRPAGDLDGDGLADLLARVVDPRGSAVNVVRGRRGGGTVDARDSAEAWLTVTSRSAAGSEAGCGSVTGAVAPGDMDGDGTPDLVVAALGCAPSANYSLWLIRGGAGGTVVPGADPRAVLLATDAGGDLGVVGDVNGDGLADVATRTEGWLIVLFGSAAPRPVAIPRPVTNLHGPVALVIHAGCSYLTYPDGPLGDVNGDGRADLIVNGSDLCIPDADGGFVVYGTPTGGSLALEDVVSRGAGLAVDRPLEPAAGDRNGDGLADLIARPTDLDASTYVIFGRAAPGTIAVRGLGAAGVRYTVVPAALPNPHRSAFGVPDADGDGRPELAFTLTQGRSTPVETITILGSRVG